ncbi:Uncharacterised protein [Citrobacter freundii]|nr:Uncharacterised protein [Citrobacter freundii]
MKKTAAIISACMLTFAPERLFWFELRDAHQRWSINRF